MRIVTALFLQISFIVLTFTTGILGGAPLLLLFSVADRYIIFSLQVASILVLCHFGLFIPALFVFSLWIMIQIYLGLYKKTFFKRTLVAGALGSACFLIILGIGLYSYAGDNILNFLTTSVERYIKETQHITGNLELDVKGILMQFPSIIICLFGINMWLATVFEKRSKISILERKTDKELKNYRTPEPFIWLVIVSLLFSFLKTPFSGAQQMALNILNVSLLLYFFQGLSVLSFIMDKLKFNPIFKMVVNFLFIIQIILPICLGILDFWLNFRVKISKKTV